MYFNRIYILRPTQETKSNHIIGINIVWQVCFTTDNILSYSPLSDKAPDSNHVGDTIGDRVLRTLDGII